MNDGRTLRPREAGAPEARKRPRPTPELVAGPSKSQSSVISFEDTPRFIERYPAISLQLDEVLKEVELKLRQRFLRDSNARQKRNLKSDGINPFLLSTAIDSAPQPASSQKSLSQKMKQVALQPSKLQSSLTSDNRNRPPARQNRPAFHFAPLQRFTQPQETPFSIQIANDDVKNHTRPNLQQELTSVAGLKSFPYMLEWEDTKVSEQVLKAMDEQFGRAAHKRSKAEKRAKEEASIRPLLFDEIAMAPLDPARIERDFLVYSIILREFDIDANDWIFSLDRAKIFDNQSYENMSTRDFLDEFLDYEIVLEEGAKGKSSGAEVVNEIEFLLDSAAFKHTMAFAEVVKFYLSSHEIGWTLPPNEQQAASESIQCQFCPVSYCEMHRQIPHSARLVPPSTATGVCRRNCWRGEEMCIVSEWTAAEKGLLGSYARSEVGVTSCELALAMGKPCFEIHHYLQTLQLALLHRSALRPSLGRNAQSISKAPAARRAIAETNGYVPCQHAGPCENSADCSCVRNGTRCDIFCGCDQLDCARAFRGCTCRQSNESCNMAERCPCVEAVRSCDPRYCGCCLDVVHATHRLERCQNSKLVFKDFKATVIATSTLENAGFGLFAAERLRKGDCLGVYAGEIFNHVSSIEGLVRDARNNGLAGTRTTSYWFDVDNHNAIDSGAFGNNMRYLNNQARSKTNCVTKPTYYDGIHHLAIYVSVDSVDAGEELYLHYGGTYFTAPNGAQKEVEMESSSASENE